MNISHIKNKRFIATIDSGASIKATTSNHTENGRYGIGWANVHSSYAPPSLSLNGDMLTITPAKITASGSAIGCIVNTTNKFMSTNVYYPE